MSFPWETTSLTHPVHKKNISVLLSTGTVWLLHNKYKQQIKAHIRSNIGNWDTFSVFDKSPVILYFLCRQSKSSTQVMKQNRKTKVSTYSFYSNTEDSVWPAIPIPGCKKSAYNLDTLKQWKTHRNMLSLLIIFCKLVFIICFMRLFVCVTVKIMFLYSFCSTDSWCVSL